MRKSKISIPVNSMSDGFSQSISVERMTIKKSDFHTQQDYDIAKDPHRDDGYTFHIVEAGTVLIEIDFHKYEVTAPAVVYMHPSQVHSILGFDEVTVCSMAIKSDALNADYLQLLEDIVPAEPLVLTKESTSKVLSIFSLSLDFFKDDINPLRYSLLRDSCNTLVVYLISQFLQQQRQAVSVSRYEIVNQSFRRILEKQFGKLKRAGDYADQLNISVAYLNECISATTGISVTRTIHNRIILEAQRMLYHTNKSVKEISADLGYDDYTYFSKLFNKVVGVSALAFRNKNRD